MPDLAAAAAIAGLASSGISAYNTIAGSNASAAASNNMVAMAPFNFILQQAQADYANKQAENALLEGQYEKQAADYQGDNALASAQAQASQDALQGKLALSKLQAEAASGGGTASDTGTVMLAGQVGGQSRYNTLVDLYNGQTARNAAIDQGNIALYGAQQQAAALRQQAGNYNAAGIQALAQGNIDRANASMIRKNGYMNAGGTLLGNAANIGLAYKQSQSPYSNWNGNTTGVGTPIDLSGAAFNPVSR